MQKHAYAARLKDQSILLKSSSGGFFTAIAQKVLAEKGVVFGVSTSPNGRFEHCQISSSDQLFRIQGTKYVASDTNTTYQQVKENLRQGKTVLYGGCPCQIAGLHAFLGREYENLITADIICHGTPSQKLFSTYLRALQKKVGAVEKYHFRDKSKYGWGVYWSYTKENGKVKCGGLHDDPYITHFIDGTTYRESCYHCKYLGAENRPGDITLGDYWGVDRFHPRMASKLGVSAVIVHTPQGKMWVERALDSCVYEESTVENIARYNPSLTKAAKRPAVRDTIYHGIDEFPPEVFCKEKLTVPFKGYCMTKIRLMMPYWFRVLIKKVKS